MHVHCATVNATQLSAVAKAGKVKAVHFEEPRLGCFSSLQQAVSQELGLFTYTHPAGDESHLERPSSAEEHESASGTSISTSRAQFHETQYPSWLHSRIKCVGW